MGETIKSKAMRAWLNDSKIAIECETAGGGSGFVLGVRDDHCRIKYDTESAITYRTFENITDIKFVDEQAEDSTVDLEPSADCEESADACQRMIICMVEAKRVFKEAFGAWCINQKGAEGIISEIAFKLFDSGAD